MADGSEATASALAAIWPEHQPGLAAEVDADEWHRWLGNRAHRLSAEKTVKECKALEDESRNRLVAAAKNAEVLTVDGVTVGTLRTVAGTHVEYERKPYRVLRDTTKKEP
jgi:hypothetical protein